MPRVRKAAYEIKRQNVGPRRRQLRVDGRVTQTSFRHVIRATRRSELKSFIQKELRSSSRWRVDPYIVKISIFKESSVVDKYYRIEYRNFIDILILSILIWY